ncbi:MAG: hypothetical protein ACOX8S_07040 [Christensenellales bacterium]|jgi:ABC-type glycerol-3-phosphate transport system substrate-binding protein
MKRCALILISIALLLTGCLKGASSPTPPASPVATDNAPIADMSEDIVDIKWLGRFASYKNSRQNEILKLLNETLQSDGHNIEVQMNFETIKEYDEIIQREYAAGSFDYDLVSTFFDFGWALPDLARAGLIKSLDEYGEIHHIRDLDLVKQQHLWDMAYVDGQCYGIPMPDFSGQSSHTARILMRADIMRQENIPSPTDVGELIEAAAKISQAMGGAQIRILDEALPPVCPPPHI